MLKWTSAMSALAVIAVLSVAAVGCDSLLSPGDNIDPGDVGILNGGFTPAVDTVAVGTTVTWTNLDTGDHTVTSDTGSFYSATLHTGGRYPHTFSTPGTYSYHCLFNPSLTGTIVVQ
jgi:plastocyanin